MDDNEWHGEERRKNLAPEIEMLVQKMDSIYACLVREFGGHDKITGFVEGNVTKQLKELNGKLTEASNRVTALENWRWFVLGACAILTIFIDVIFRK